MAATNTSWEPGPEAGPLPDKLGPRAPGEAGLASRRLGIARMGRFELLSATFRDGSPLPGFAPLQGEVGPPNLHWQPFLPQPESFVLICEDPDAPGRAPFVHWLVYGIPGHVIELDDNLEEFLE